jgi:DNA-binding NtrC family response regulator
LATVFGIVTQAGGDVSIYTELGIGTTVRAYLPATTQTAPAAPSSDAIPSLSAHGETVLLVEDEEMVREPTRRMLVRNGYVVLTADNALDALEIVSSHSGPIDLLLTDVVMPGRSGKDLASDVVARRPATKLLFMSGYSENVIVHDGVLDAGVNLIEKPFSADDLLHWMRSILDAGSGVVPPRSRRERHEL